MRRGIASRYIPEGAEAHEGNGVVCYKYSDSRGRFYAIAYGGKRSKSDYHYSYGTDEARCDKKIADTLAAYAERAACKAKERELKKAAVNPFKPGDVLSCSWGYEQTNVDFYVVLAATKRMVTMAACGKKSVGDATSWASDTVVPCPDTVTGEPMKKRVGISVYSGETRAYITMNSYSSAYKWDGRPKHRSWYA